MGQQQIVFLILALCIVGIALSAYAIVRDGEADHRTAMSNDLQQLALSAQSYRTRSFEDGGGDGTFIGLTATPQGFERLVPTFSRTYARYFISKTGNSRCVELTALGFFPGIDPRKPMKLTMTVYADSMRLTVVN